MPSEACLFPQQFSNLLVTQLPVYTDMILRDVRPQDGLLGHIQTGQWDPFQGVQQTIDRFRHVEPNVAKKWEDVSETTCTGNPCDPMENEISWGWDRTVFGQQRQSWKSQMLCFDQMISATKAVEHIEQIVSEILRPATNSIGSFYVRKKALEFAGYKFLADATLTPFTYSWKTTGNEEIFMTPSALPTSKLTPEMIQRQLNRLRFEGYFGKWTNDPFWGGYDNFAELLTDDDTCWDMDKIATNQRVSDLWRFQQWNAAHEYYAYGMGGQIGNYMTHVDPRCLRFNLAENGTDLQLVLPLKNAAAHVGIGSKFNSDFDLAQYQISFIWHRMAISLEVQQLQKINSLMPFLVRGLSGQWNFAIHDLGSDCNTGRAISNYRQNKGFFWADWRWGIKPMHTEWMTAFLHKREPKVIYVVAPCAADPGYPAQSYSSAGTPCTDTYTWEPDAAANGHFVIEENTVACGDVPVDNGAIDSASLAALVIALNGDAAMGALGTWSANGTLLVLTGATCQPDLPWVVS